MIMLSSVVDYNFSYMHEIVGKSLKAVYSYEIPLSQCVSAQQMSFHIDHKAKKTHTDKQASPNNPGLNVAVK